MKRFLSISVLILILATGCATTGGKKTEQQNSLSTESGIGITVWKIPIIGVGFWGWWDQWWGPGVSRVVVHKYDYQARPPALPYGTPPSPPTAPPPTRIPVMPKEQSLQSSWDDPSIVVFKNGLPFETELEIDGGKIAYNLEPYGITPDIPLPIGRHKVKFVIKKPTATYDTWKVVRFLEIDIRPEGRSQIFYIY